MNQLHIYLFWLKIKMGGRTVEIDHLTRIYFITDKRAKPLSGRYNLLETTDPQCTEALESALQDDATNVRKIQAD